MRQSPRYLVLAALLVACSDARQRKSADTVANAERVAFSPRPAVPTVATNEIAPAPQSVWNAQKLIRTADLRIQVDDVGTSMRDLDRIIALRDALIADSRADRTEKGIPNAQVMLRVPAQNFSALMGDLRALGTVRNESTRGEDVTKDYADLETRITVKQETADRIRVLLASQTGNLAQVLEVERELARVVTELEQLKGQRRYYDQQVADATVAVQLFDKRQAEAPGFGAAVTGALHKSLNALEAVAAQLIYVGVFLVPWVVLALLGWRATKRWRRPATS